MDSDDPNFKEQITFTPEIMYRVADEYIEEDHVDGKDNPEDHIVTYGAESSYVHEDCDKDYDEHVVVVADFGEEVGTKTCATIEGIENLDAINNLLEFIKNPEY